MTSPSDQLSIYFLWLDLETTGPDPGFNSPIEVGAMITHPYPPYESPESNHPTEFVSVIEPDGWPSRTMWEDNSLRMAVQSGLYNRLEGSTGLTQVAMNLVGFVQPWLNHDGKIALAGSGVTHFDLKFLKHCFPLLYDYLGYPHYYDVGQLRRWIILEHGEDARYQAPKMHRALADVELHIAEANHYRKYLKGELP